MLLEAWNVILFVVLWKYINNFPQIFVATSEENSETKTFTQSDVWVKSLKFVHDSRLLKIFSHGIKFYCPHSLDTVIERSSCILISAKTLHAKDMAQCELERNDRLSHNGYSRSVFLRGKIFSGYHRHTWGTHRIYLLSNKC